MIMKIAKLLMQFVLSVAALLALIVAGCALYLLVVWLRAGPAIPSSNTPEFQEYVGIVNGQTNEIWLGDVLFRIPPEIRFTISPEVPFKKKHADIIWATLLAYPQYVDPNLKLMGYSDYDALVSATISGGVEIPSEWNKRNPRIGGKFLKEIGLVESINESRQGAMGTFVYTPINEKITTPRGNRLLFECDRDRLTMKPLQCDFAFQHVKGPMVQLVFGGPLLPHWQEIYRDANERIDSMIAK